MKQFPTKVQTESDAEKHKPRASRQQSVRAYANPAISTGVHTQIQRKAQCACGGGCPRCQGLPLLQAKLQISQPGDQYEQEADRVAEQVMRMPDEATPAAVRPMRERGILLQGKEATGRVAEVNSNVQTQINSLQGGGHLLPESVRAFFEPRFGRDFSQVRLHTGAQAAESAQAANALAFTVGQNIVFGAGQYTPDTDAGKRLLAHELTHIAQQSREPQMLLQRQEGTQSFAGASPGTEAVDPLLSGQNQIIEQEMMREAERYESQGDLRWFFAFAHATITSQINRNIGLFQRPNAMLRLNIHFAEEFMRAVYDQPLADWQRAFQICSALDSASESNYALVFEAEWCGAMMANTHIHVDLRNALREVGCIPPTDYGNMLAFVNRGSLAALARLRGQRRGTTEAILQSFIAPLMSLDVRAWRNAVYESVCHTTVPDVQPGFP